MKLHVRTGDTVVVISGKHKGARGKILRTEPDRGRVVVEQVNLVKRHQRPTAKVMQGGIIQKEAPIHASNVMLVCTRCHKPTRVGHTFLEGGRKVRVCRRCGEVIDR
ncbi:MAG: 50S ribosomal protein L24 [Bacillota bacterium]|nr:50S ribosomal protein L24 [Bacillota bacterium]MDI7249879.1 50S ribosomal protein L24 [Bacillota bacterium]